MFQVKNYLEKNEPHVNKAAFGVSSQKKWKKNSKFLTVSADRKLECFMTEK